MRLLIGSRLIIAQIANRDDTIRTTVLNSELYFFFVLKDEEEKMHFREKRGDEMPAHSSERHVLLFKITPGIAGVSRPPFQVSNVGQTCSIQGKPVFASVHIRASKYFPLQKWKSKNAIVYEYYGRLKIEKPKPHDSRDLFLISLSNLNLFLSFSRETLRH